MSASEAAPAPDGHTKVRARPGFRRNLRCCDHLPTQPLPSTVEGKLDAAEELKKAGNEKFSAKNLVAATRKYKTALLYLRSVVVDSKAEEVQLVQGRAEPLSDAQVARERSLRLACLSNLATCFAQRGKFEDCLRSAKEVLEIDADHEKALFRKASAEAELGMLDG